MSNNGGRKRRAGSVKQVIENIESDPSHHLAGSLMPQNSLKADAKINNGPTARRRKVETSSVPPDFYESKGMWTDLKTLRWMRVPSASFKLLMIPVLCYLNWSFINPGGFNPFAPLLFLSYPLPGFAPDDQRYGKGYLDIAFVLYYVIVASFVRQFMILKVIHPIARRLGIRGEAKLDRFGEQGYAMFYYGGMGIWGLYIMTTLPTWWYRTEYFWIDYPHWEMKKLLKRFYLMQMAYWYQQLIIVAIKLEKPRKDYKELVAHHIVTLYLITWSYGINYTIIGIAVFVSMDVPDTLLALSKLCNYLDLTITKSITYVIFLGFWTYFRHYLNLVMIWSIWSQSKLAPESSKRLSVKDGIWMPSWMRYQILLPMVLLQLLNLFWYVLMWRILIRALTAGELDDERSDDEGGDDDEDDEEEKED